jgi:hypothetical protein
MEQSYMYERSGSLGTKLEQNMLGIVLNSMGSLTLNSIVKEGQKELVVHQQRLLESPQSTNILRDLH